MKWAFSEKNLGGRVKAVRIPMGLPKFDVIGTNHINITFVAKHSGSISGMIRHLMNGH